MQGTVRGTGGTGGYGVTYEKGLSSRDVVHLLKPFLKGLVRTINQSPIRAQSLGTL